MPDLFYLSTFYLFAESFFDSGNDVFVGFRDRDNVVLFGVKIYEGELAAIIVIGRDVGDVVGVYEYSSSFLLVCEFDKLRLHIIVVC